MLDPDVNLDSKKVMQDMPVQNALAGVEVARALLNWWTLAGVDCAISETPGNRLAGSRPPATADTLTAQRPAISDSAAGAAMPDDLDVFIVWLARSPQGPEQGIRPAYDASDLIVPTITRGGRPLLVLDAPSDEDARAGQLFSGDAGLFVSAILGSIGVDSASASLASLFLLNPGTVPLPASALSAATARLCHLVGLAQPSSVILFGDRTSRAWDGTDSGAGRASLPFVNHSGATVPVVHAPALPVLMRKGDRKAALWRDLRALGASH